MRCPCNFSIGSSQARASLPSSSTLHAPQVASSHPYLQPVRRSTSRRYHSSGIEGSPVWRKFSPLMATSIPVRIGSGVMPGSVRGSRGIARLYSLRAETVRRPLFVAAVRFDVRAAVRVDADGQLDGLTADGAVLDVAVSAGFDMHIVRRAAVGTGQCDDFGHYGIVSIMQLWRHEQLDHVVEKTPAEFGCPQDSRSFFQPAALACFAQRCLDSFQCQTCALLKLPEWRAISQPRSEEHVFERQFLSRDLRIAADARRGIRIFQIGAGMLDLPAATHSCNSAAFISRC